MSSIELPDTKLPTTKLANTIPNELWHNVESFLPQIQKHLIFTALWPKDWRDLSARQKHSILWSRIFKDDAWLSAAVKKGFNPVLVGHDLYKIYERKDEPTYLALVLGYDGHGGRDGHASWCGAKKRPYNSSLFDLFFQSLRETSIEDGEQVFPHIKLVLNTRDATSDYESTHVSDPAKLLSFHSDGPHSAYLYWEDDTFMIHEIKPDRVVGLINGKYMIPDVMVGLEWDHLPSNFSRQHYFAAAGADPNTQYINWPLEDGKVTGWKWRG